MTEDPAAGLSDLDVLALTLHHEAGGQGVAGMQAVASVITNRAAWGRWGPTVRDVCLAYKQFSCWKPMGGRANYDALVAHAGQLRQGVRPLLMARAYTVAEGAMRGAFPDPTHGATHYWAPNAMVPKGSTPVWARGQTPTARIGGHIFLNLRPTDETRRT